jgi:hypothetical protein
MATSAFARRVLWFLVFFVCISLALLATYIGMFGEAAQIWLHTHLLPLRATYRAHKGAVDLVALVIGTSVPVVTGGLAILRGFYYAEINLPKRLQELVDAARQQHLHQRPRILSYVKTPFDTTDFLTPTILANPFSELLKLVGWVSLRNQARDFATSVDQFTAEIRTLNLKREDIENRKVTGHFLRAAYFEAGALAAEDQRDQSPNWKIGVESALKEYKAVLALRPDDLDALHWAAVQCHRLEDEAAESKYLETTITVAAQKKNNLAQARALRKSARIIDLRSSPNEWNAARAQLVTARRLIEHKAGGGTPEARELAETLLLYGDVQTKREKFRAARRALNRAALLFATTPADVRQSGKERVNHALARLDEAFGDKEAFGG